MPPFAGEGANTALFDAVKLSEYLTSENIKSTADAIAAYENEMRERASKATVASLENGERMHSKTALQTMLNLFST
jgi:2-polyprenyl-6-methoxyphenol hydroxylase-like FAD-dependent oxidoreductase